MQQRRTWWDGKTLVQFYYTPLRTTPNPHKPLNWLHLWYQEGGFLREFNLWWQYFCLNTITSGPAFVAIHVKIVLAQGEEAISLVRYFFSLLHASATFPNPRFCEITINQFKGNVLFWIRVPSRTTVVNPQFGFYITNGTQFLNV